MKAIKSFGLVFILVSIAQLALAQGKFNVAFRPSASAPLKDFGMINLKKGGGFEATFTFQFMPGFTTYGGWGWNIFLPEEETPSFDHLKETGYRFGLQRVQPLSKESKLNFLFSAGAVLNHIETENDKGDIIDDSGHGLGWEVDIGLSIPLNEKWQIVPGVRYHALSREILTDGVLESVDLSYMAVGVSVSWTLVED